MIPFKRFHLDYADMWNVLALERLNMIDALMVGTALARPTKEQEKKLAAMLERQLDEAYPKD